MSLLNGPLVRFPSCRFIAYLFSVTTISVIDLFGKEQNSLEWNVWLLGQSDSTHMIEDPCADEEP